MGARALLLPHCCEEASDCTVVHMPHCMLHCVLGMKGEIATAFYEET